MKSLEKCRLTAVLCAAALLCGNFCSAPNIKSNAETEEYEGYTFTYSVTAENTAEITGCSGDAEYLIIPETLGGLDVTAIGNGAFKAVNSFDTLSLPKSLKSIGNNAFYGCKNLGDVVIPDSVVSIGERAFMSCTSLKTVDIGCGVSSLGDYSFGACSELTTVSVDSENPCFSTSENMLLSKDGSKLIQYAGDKETADIPEKISCIGKGAFFGVTDITNVNIPSGVESIEDYAFSGCISLKEIRIPDSVKALGKGSFINCTALKKAEIGSGITEIPVECFAICSNLSDLKLPDSLVTLKMEAFYGCLSLTDIDVPKSVTKMESNCLGTYYDLRTNSIINVNDVVISGASSGAARIYAKLLGIKFVDYDNMLLGDVDFSGAVDAIDASLALTEYAAISSGRETYLRTYEKAAADFDANGIIDAIDASLILSVYVKNSTS